MNRIIGILIAAFICASSCKTYKEVKGSELSQAFILNSSPTFKGYYYKGSDSNFHYFVSKWDVQNDKNFKIAIESLKVESKYSFEPGEKELRVDVLYKSNELFGENQFYKLYILNLPK